MNVSTLKRTHDEEFAACSRDFWRFVAHLKTYDEENEKIRRFPIFEYLHDLHDDVESYQKVIVLKSRRLVVSWYGMARQLWRAKFVGIADSSDVYHGGVMSIGQEEAHELMNRIRFMHENLPEWMRVRNVFTMNNLLHIRFEAGGDIHAFPLKREGPRTFGFTEVFFDEMAFQEAVRSVWTGMAPTLGAKGRVLAVSTPNGKGNLFHDMWINKNNRYADLFRLKLEWHQNPEHGEDWVAGLKKSMDDQMIARELGLSFSVYAGDKVWPKFDKLTHIFDEEPDVIEGSPVYIGWDLGFHNPAIVLAQVNSRDQLVIFGEVHGEDAEMSKFCKQVLQYCATKYDRRKCPEIHCLPPDARNRYRATNKQTGAVNDATEIQVAFKTRPGSIKFGPGQVGTRDNEKPRLKETRKLFELRADGNPGILFSPGCEMLIEGCMGGYCYPERKHNAPVGEDPMKNEYSHTQDALQMVVTCYNRIVNREADKKKDQPRRDRISELSGFRIG